ncbi:MAG: hypothetical protein WA624_19580 [Methylocella sp.]
MFFAFGFILLPTLALTSPMLEQLLNYPVDTTGYMTIPRGVTLVGGLVLMSFVPAWIDNRLFVVGGMALVVYGNWRMLGYSPAMDWRPVVVAGALQGLGLGALMPALKRRRSARSIRSSVRRAPHSSTCRASMAARSVSRWSRSRQVQREPLPVPVFGDVCHGPGRIDECGIIHGEFHGLSVLNHR